MAAVGTIFNVFSHNVVCAENRTHYLPKRRADALRVPVHKTLVAYKYWKKAFVGLRVYTKNKPNKFVYYQKKAEFNL